MKQTQVHLIAIDKKSDSEMFDSSSMILRKDNQLIIIDEKFRGIHTFMRTIIPKSTQYE